MIARGMMMGANDPTGHVRGSSRRRQRDVFQSVYAQGSNRFHAPRYLSGLSTAPHTRESTLRVSSVPVASAPPPNGLAQGSGASFTRQRQDAVGDGQPTAVGGKGHGTLNFGCVESER